MVNKTPQYKKKEMLNQFSLFKDNMHIINASVVWVQIDWSKFMLVFDEN